MQYQHAIQNFRFERHVRLRVGQPLNVIIFIFSFLSPYLSINFNIILNVRWYGDMNLRVGCVCKYLYLIERRQKVFTKSTPQVAKNSELQIHPFYILPEWKFNKSCYFFYIFNIHFSVNSFESWDSTVFFSLQKWTEWKEKVIFWWIDWSLWNRNLSLRQMELGIS